MDYNQVMKKILFIVLLSAGSAAQAQQKAEALDPGKGCWVVESNVNSPQKQIVKFYNSDLQLVYQEYYDRKQLNYSKKNIRRMLDSALVTALKVKNGSDESVKMANVIKHNH